MTLAIKLHRRVRGRKAQTRGAQIDAIAGRYAKVPTSSKRFAAQKRREIEREGGGR